MKHKFANNGTLPANLRLNQLRYDAKKKYGLSLAEVQYLREQPCEICGTKAKKCVLIIKYPALTAVFYANNAILDLVGLKNTVKLLMNMLREALKNDASAK